MDDCIRCTSATKCTKCGNKFLDTTGKGCVDKCETEDVAAPAAWGDASDPKNKRCRRCDEKKGNMTNCLRCKNEKFCL